MVNKNSLVIFSRASQMLAEADSILKAKELKSLALTAADWAKRKRMGEKAIQHCRSYAAEAERRMGQLLAETPLQQGSRGIGKSGVTRCYSTLTLGDFGLSKMESSRAQKLADLPVEVFEQVRDGKMTRAQAERERKTAEKQAQMEKAAARLSTEKDVVDIRRCSCKELFASGIKPDAVITDPPYPEKFLPLFTELAESCKNVPLVAVMIGQTYFPDILSRLCEHLTYRWTLAYLTPGGQSAQQFPVKINAFWKPVLLFGKAAHWLGDVARSAINDNDKTHHHWGQSESGMTDLVERLTPPGQLVCDPFKGAGTTALASLALNRRFVGCDIDKKSVEQAKLRVRSSKGWETYGNEIQADQRGRNLGIAGSVAA